MTEASPVVLFIPVNSPKSKLGSIGQVYSGTEVKVVDLITGETLGPHKSGELLIRGPQVNFIFINIIRYLKLNKLNL